MPAAPSAVTIICNCGAGVAIHMSSPTNHGSEKHVLTLSYHRFVQVPTCTPPTRRYVPHKKFPQSSPRSSGAASSRHTTNSARSTTWRHAALRRSRERVQRKLDHTFRFSVVSTPSAFLATSAVGSLSASATIACKLRRTSRSVRRGQSCPSRTSNQSGGRENVIVEIVSEHVEWYARGGSHRTGRAGVQ